jgi:hypothetical protein
MCGGTSSGTLAAAVTTGVKGKFIEVIATTDGSKGSPADVALQLATRSYRNIKGYTTGTLCAG